MRWPEYVREVLRRRTWCKGVDADGKVVHGMTFEHKQYWWPSTAKLPVEPMHV